MTYSPYDTATWAAGSLPTDGVHSLQRPGVGQALAVAVKLAHELRGGDGEHRRLACSESPRRA
jgi:hypothetical protein